MIVDGIAHLPSLGLTPEAREARRHGLGGSDATVVMSGNRDKINTLWRVKRGLQPDADLSDQLHVVLGQWTEPFNAAWYQKTTGRRVLSRGELYEHPDFPWYRATSDGVTTYAGGGLGLWEAKHVGGFEDLLTETVPRYVPQLFHNMLASGLRRATLSVFAGTGTFRVFDFDWDVAYAAELWTAEHSFWLHVRDCTEPHPADPVVPPRPVGELETRALDDDPDVMRLVESWLELRPHAKAFDDVARDLKGRIPADVGKALCGPLVVSRNKGGALTVREAKAAKSSEGFA